MPKTTASWNGQIIAASDHCIAVEGNAYFPPEALDMKFFKPNCSTSGCPVVSQFEFQLRIASGMLSGLAASLVRFHD